MALEHDAAPATPQAAPAAVVAAAPVVGAPMGDDEILSLQKTAGNRAVGRAIDRGLIQRRGHARRQAARRLAEGPGAQGTTD